MYVHVLPADVSSLYIYVGTVHTHAQSNLSALTTQYLWATLHDVHVHVHWFPFYDCLAAKKCMGNLLPEKTHEYTDVKNVDGMYLYMYCDVYVHVKHSSLVVL